MGISSLLPRAIGLPLAMEYLVTGINGCPSNSLARLYLAEVYEDDGHDALAREQILEIRRWIDDGFYDLPTTVEEVARRILESGDLDF